MCSWKLDLSSYQRQQSNIPGCMKELINNDKMICRLLNIIYGHDTDDVLSVLVKKLTPGTDVQGNLSDCGRVSISVVMCNGDKHQYSWFVKVQPIDHQNSELFSQFNLFENEIEFYQKIAPELREFVEESQSEGTDIQFDIPELIHAEMEDDRAIIILEDLVGAGYRQVKDDNGDRYLTLEEALLAVESIAKIHAASYALQLKRNINLGSEHPNLEVSGMLWSNDEMASRLTTMKDYYCDILKESDKPDSPVLVERFQKKFDSPEKLKQMCTMRTRKVSESNDRSLSCLEQGDFHFNNLMFKQEDDGSMNVRIVDWQMTYTGRAGGDVAYLLMSSIAPELYDSDEETIKERYFEMFNETFYNLIREKSWKQMVEEVEEMLEQDYEESLPLGFLFSCGNVMNKETKRESQVSFAYHLCNEAAIKNLI